MCRNLGYSMSLTKGRNDGTRDAVGHTDCKDAHGPGVLQAELELIGLTLHMETQTQQDRRTLKQSHNLILLM